MLGQKAVWLEQQLPKYAVVHPAQTSASKHAIKFLAELERALAHAAAAPAPPPSFDSPEPTARPAVRPPLLQGSHRQTSE